jgi:hypothetical protein
VTLADISRIVVSVIIPTSAGPKLMATAIRLVSARGQGPGPPRWR